jgi:hypothetical protein
VSALEPQLTRYDLKVLRLVPEHGPEPVFPRTEHVTVWQLAEALDTDDVQELRRILGSLEQLGYVWKGDSRSKRRPVYWRTPKGDEAAA